MNNCFRIVKRTWNHWAGLIVYGTIILILIVFSFIVKAGILNPFGISVLFTFLPLIILLVLFNNFSRRYVVVGEIEFGKDEYQVTINGKTKRTNYLEKPNITFIYYSHEDEYIPLRVFFFGNKICDGADNVIKIKHTNKTSCFRVFIKDNQQKKSLDQTLLNLKERYKLNVKICNSFSRLLTKF